MGLGSEGSPETTYVAVTNAGTRTATLEGAGDAGPMLWKPLSPP